MASKKISALIQLIDEHDSSDNVKTNSKRTNSNISYADDDKKEEPVSKNSPRILIADKLGEFVMDKLSKSTNIHFNSTLSGDALRDQIKTFQPNIIVVRSTKVQKEHLSAASSLSLIIRAGAGTNTIDVNEASSRGIYVANCPGKNAIAVAELAMGHLVNMDRRISDNVASLRNGTWNKKEFGKARGLCGRTIAILGTGNIGSEVCKRALSFGMVVRGYSLNLTQEKANRLGIVYCKSLKEAVTGVDALSVHIPHNDKTHHIINKEILSLVNDGAYIINTSRGGVVDEKAISELIKTKNIRYGCDVYENEPKASDKEFTDKNIFTNKNIYGSHHIGASTAEASDSVGSEVLRIAETFLSSGKVCNCVNLERQSPAKYSVSIRHKDVVGVLADILDILKKEKINVQEMKNIVFRGSKSACAVLQIDSEPSNDAITNIKNLKHVYGVEVSKK